MKYSDRFSVLADVTASVALIYLSIWLIYAMKFWKNYFVTDDSSSLTTPLLSHPSILPIKDSGFAIDLVPGSNIRAVFSHSASHELFDNGITLEVSPAGFIHLCKCDSLNSYM